MPKINDPSPERGAPAFAAAVVSYYHQRLRPRYAADLPRGAAEWQIFWADVVQEIQEVRDLFALEAEAYAELIQAATCATSEVGSLELTTELWHNLKSYQAAWQPKWPRPPAPIAVVMTWLAPTPADWHTIQHGMQLLREQRKISCGDNSDETLRHFAQHRFTSLKEFYDFRREIEYAFYTYYDYNRSQQYVSQKAKQAYQAKLAPKAPFILPISPV